MRFMRHYGKGWYYESWRHSLAAKGFATKKGTISAELRDQLARPDVTFDLGETKKVGDVHLTTPDGVVAYQRMLSDLAQNLADQKISFNEFEKMKISPEGKSRVRDQVSGLLARRAGIAQARAELQAKTKTQAAVPGYKKVQEKRKLEEEEKITLRVPLLNFLERAKNGDFSVPERTENDNEQLLVAEAVYEGVQKRIDTGRSVDYKVLEEQFFLTPKQLNELKAYQNIVAPSLIRRTGRVVLGKGEEALGAAGSFLKTHAQDVRERIVPSMGEVSGGKLEDIKKKIEEEKKTLAEGKGVFNPLGVGLFGEDVSSKQKKLEFEKNYAEAISSERDINSLWSNRKQLSRVDLSAYDKGENAFKQGDREGLLDAIVDLSAQQAKIQDNWIVTEGARNSLLQKNTVDKMIAKEESGSSGSNPFFGGSGGAKIGDLTKKVAVVQQDLKKSSNAVASRISLLRNKVRRLDASVVAKDEAPEKEVSVLRGSNFHFAKPFEGINGQLRHKNPIFEGKIKNPAIEDVEL